jgi:carnitine O-acetyltransferase
LAARGILKFGIESKRSSTETSTHGFRLKVIEALREMKAICEEAQQPRGGGKAKL